MACNFCRLRKRRCDGQRPTCGLCKSRGHTCVYAESIHASCPSATTSSAQVGGEPSAWVEEVLESHRNALEDIKSLLCSYVLGLSATKGRDDVFNSAPLQDDRRNSISGSETYLYPPASLDSYRRPEGKFKSPFLRENNSELPPLMIPATHEASSSSMLSLPQVQRMAGEFPDEFFFRVEVHRSKASSSPCATGRGLGAFDAFQVNRETADVLVTSFFETVHPFHPILDRASFDAQYEETIALGIQHNEQSAVVLAVLSLGALMRENPNGSQHRAMGSGRSLDYHRTAQQICTLLWPQQSIGGNLVLCQGLFLCGLYLMYVVYPLLAWGFVHMASTGVEQLLSRSGDANAMESRVQEIIRLSWACFDIECDILAEFPQPRSCIQSLADVMIFPKCDGPGDTARFYFLAEMSARSLANRIHYSVNFTDSINTYTGRSWTEPSADGAGTTDSLTSVVAICDELSHQLETWYGSLPANIKPNLDPDLPDDNHQSCLLRCRYWSNMNKIHRPFILRLTSLLETQHTSSFLVEKCKVCITACRMSLKSIRGLLSRRTPYVYNAALGNFAAILILSMAASSPQLKDSIPDLDDLQGLALDNIRPWAVEGSAIASAYDILSSIRKKFQYLKRF